MEFGKEGLEALKIHQAEYLNSVWKTFAALMVSIGWVMSSQETREFLTKKAPLMYMAIGVILVMALMHWLTLYDLYKKSQRITLAAATDNNLYSAIGESYMIKREYIFASFLINGLLCLLLVTTILNA
jgi:hypothetical protein